jgi:polysaccharide export outer membrane protein
MSGQEGLIVRHFFRFAALLLFMLANFVGCQSLDEHKIATRGVPQDRPIPRLVDRPVMTLVHQNDLMRTQSGRTASPALSLVGVIAEESGPYPPAPDTEAFGPIDINPQPSGNFSYVWGHSSLPDNRTRVCESCGGGAVFPSTSCPTCRSAGGRNCRPDSPLFFPDAQCDDGSWAVTEHRIRVGDELEIKFPHKPLFSEKVMVGEDGMISLPLIAPVYAAGLTPEELRQSLAEKFRAFQYDPLAVRENSVAKKYLLSVNDKLEIRFDNEQPSSQMTRLNDAVTIRPDGKISLPLIGTVQAEGQTPEELEAEVAGRYRKYYKDADPVLIVREFTNNQVLVDGKMTRMGIKNLDDVVVLTRSYERMVFVGGEVNRPGFVKLKGPMTVTQAIIAAGGLKPTAELRTVAMFHEDENNKATGKLLNLKCQWTYENQKRIPEDQRLDIEDVLLQSGDVVIVPKTMIAKINNALDQYVYQLIPMTRNTQFQYLYTTGSAVGAFGF